MDSDGIAGFIKDIVRYREPLSSLVSKEFKVRYKNAALGFLWSVLNPLLLMIVLSIVMRLIVRFPGIEHYPVFVLCGLIPWTFMAQGLSRGTGALIENAGLIQKVYFPREIIPMSTVLGCFMNFLPSIGVLFLFIMAFGYWPSVSLIMVPVIVFGELLFVMGVVLATSCLNVYYRDVAYIIESVLVIWWWGTPIFYPRNLVGDRVSSWVYHVYLANPMAATVVSLRQILLDRRFPDLYLVVVLFAAAIVSFMVGLAVFRRTRMTIVDYV